jgi:phosphorylcholine metabolism protein LicD
MKIIISILVCLVIVIIIIFGCRYSWDNHVEGLRKTRASLDANVRTNILKYLYSKIVDIFNRYDIPLWLEYGTLLGYRRENDIICYDDDLDFGAFYTDKTRIVNVLRQLEKEEDDIKVDYKCSFPGICSYGIVYKPIKLSADISMYHVDKNRLTPSFITHIYRKRKSMPKKDYLPLKRVKFLDKYIYIPNDTNKVLLDEFGSSFMTPSHRCDDNCNNCHKIS